MLCAASEGIRGSAWTHQAVHSEASPWTMAHTHLTSLKTEWSWVMPMLISFSRLYLS